MLIMTGDFILTGLLLDIVENPTTFFAISLVLQILAGIGKAAFNISYTCIICKEFKGAVVFVFAFVEISFGLGNLVGRPVGELLYEMVGYYFPLLTMCGVMLVACLPLNHSVLPHQDAIETLSSGQQPTILSLLRRPFIMLQVATVLVTSFTNSFLQTTQKDQLQSFNLPSFIMACVLSISVGMYGISAPCCGYLSNKYFSSPTVTVFGAALQTIALFLLGSASFKVIEKSLALCIFALVSHGLGNCACLVASNGAMVRKTTNMDYPDDINTYGIISGIWTTAFSFGSFLGPTLGGAIMSLIRVDYAYIVVLVLHAVLMWLYSTTPYTVPGIISPPRIFIIARGRRPSAIMDFRG